MGDGGVVEPGFGGDIVKKGFFEELAREGLGFGGDSGEFNILFVQGLHVKVNKVKIIT